MNWNSAVSTEHIDQLIERSHEVTVVILKHSSRCGISSVVLDRLGRQWDEELHTNVDSVIVDVIRSREISNYIAEKLGVRHESPQLIVIRHGKAIYDNSHMGINFAALSSLIESIED